MSEKRRPAIALSDLPSSSFGPSVSEELHARVEDSHPVFGVQRVARNDRIEGGSTLMAASVSRVANARSGFLDACHQTSWS